MPPQIPTSQNDIADAIDYNRLLRTMLAWFAPIHARLNRIERTATVAYNLQSGDGLSRVFKIVPFVNGDLPTAPPHNLPALHSERDVDALLDQEVTDYLIGYQALVADLPVADRKRQILLEIGGFGI